MYLKATHKATASNINVSKGFIWFVGEENIIINTTCSVRNYYSLFWTKSQLQWSPPNLLCGFQFWSLAPLRRDFYVSSSSVQLSVWELKWVSAELLNSRIVYGCTISVVQSNHSNVTCAFEYFFIFKKGYNLCVCVFFFKKALKKSSQL